MWSLYIAKLHKSRRGRQVFRLAFWISLFLTADILIQSSRTLVHWLNIDSMNKLAYGSLVSVQVASVVAAVLLWMGMLRHCMSGRRSVLSKAMWLILFFFGIWWTAEVYYLFFYRTSTSRVAQVSQRPGIRM